MTSIPHLSGDPIPEYLPNSASFEDESVLIVRNPEDGENNRPVKHISLNKLFQSAGRVYVSTVKPRTNTISDPRSNAFNLNDIFIHQVSASVSTAYVLKNRTDTTADWRSIEDEECTYVIDSQESMDDVINNTLPNFNYNCILIKVNVSIPQSLKLECNTRGIKKIKSFNGVVLTLAQNAGIISSDHLLEVDGLTVTMPAIVPYCISGARRVERCTFNAGSGTKLLVNCTHIADTNTFNITGNCIKFLDSKFDYTPVIEPITAPPTGNVVYEIKNYGRHTIYINKDNIKPVGNNVYTLTLCRSTTDASDKKVTVLLDNNDNANGLQLDISIDDLGRCVKLGDDPSIIYRNANFTLIGYTPNCSVVLCNTNSSSNITVTLPANTYYKGQNTISLKYNEPIELIKIGNNWIKPTVDESVNADKWKTARNITISDADGTNTGVAVSVDGSENEILKLPPTIKADLSGNADTANKLATPRKINDVDFDGSANITIADSTKAPTSHASSATTYGVASEANYGHAKASTVAGSANGVASKGTTPTVFAQSNHVHPTDATREPAFNKNTAFNKNFETTASNIKANGTQAVGASNNVPRADHVHPLQTSVSGNAGTSDKWRTARNIYISDADGTNTGTAVSVDGSGNKTLKLPATIKANVTGNASTAALATQANGIKPLGNSITLPATPTSVTKIIKIASVNVDYTGTINIRCNGANIADGVKIHINGNHSLESGVRVLYSKNNSVYGIKKIVVTADTPIWSSNRQIYAEIVTAANYSSTTVLGIIETNFGTFTPSMTEVSSVEGTVVDSLSLSYLRGDISSYQHVFTKNIIGYVISDTYSTTETRIGTWIDGKPLYRKVVNFGALPNITVKLVAHGIINLDSIIRLSGIARSGAEYLTLPHSNSSDAIYSVALSLVGNNVEIQTGTNRDNYVESKVIIEYTKTTD